MLERRHWPCSSVFIANFKHFTPFPSDSVDVFVSIVDFEHLNVCWVLLRVKNNQKRTFLYLKRNHWANTFSKTIFTDVFRVVYTYIEHISVLGFGSESACKKSNAFQANVCFLHFLSVLLNFLFLFLVF